MAEHKNRKWIVLGLAAGLAVLLLVVLASRGQAPAVPMASVGRDDLSATITSNGKVEPITATVARAQFPAFVEKVLVSEGQPVHRGQLILTLDAADVRVQLSQARANLLAARTDLQNARTGGPPDEVAQIQGDLQKAQVTVANLERTQQALEQLAARQAATQDEVAQNRAALAEAHANLESLQQRKTALAQRANVTVESAGLREREAQDQVRSLEEKVRSATVTAPEDGTLYSLPVRAGNYVRLGDTLAEMADLRHVQVRAFVDEPDLGWLEPNQPVQVSWDARPGQMWAGRTETVPKQVVTRGTRSVGEVLCSVDNDKLELLPNVNVEVRILVRTRKGALAIDRSAVHFEAGKHYVFAFDGERIHRREISVGVASTSKYELVAGLKEGERVALPGDQDLRDGMEVRAAEGK